MHSTVKLEAKTEDEEYEVVFFASFVVFFVFILINLIYA